MSGLAIELDRVAFRYDGEAMSYDLTVESGAFVVVFGPSGAGKSTLLNLIAGFDQPSEGRVRIGGRDVTDLPPARRPVSMLFQDHNLFAHLTAAENVGLGIHPGLKLRAADRERAAAALARVGLADMERRMPGQMSGGERQRVALARCLVRDRPILLLDEPFAALGPALRREMVDLVLDLQAERGLTVLLVSHQLDEAVGLDARALFVQKGAVLADGRLNDFLTAPPTREIAAYLGTAPVALRPAAS